MGIPAPRWISSSAMAVVAEAAPVPVACPENNQFKLRPEDLDATLTPRTRWLILNFPNNPTGAACSRAEMQEIAAVLLRHPHVWILTDDMYEHLVYDGFEFCTIAAVEPRLRDRVLTVNGASKAYAMTGWRVGFCGGPAPLIAAMNNMQGQATNGICTLSQAAAIAALDGPQDLLGERAAIYRERRDLVVDWLSQARGISAQAGRRVLRLSEYRRLHRQDHARRPASRHRRRLRRGLAAGAACRHRAGLGLWHESLLPDFLRDGHGQPGGGLRQDSGVLPESTVNTRPGRSRTAASRSRPVSWAPRGSWPTCHRCWR